MYGRKAVYRHSYIVYRAPHPLPSPLRGEGKRLPPLCHCERSVAERGDLIGYGVCSL